jgi:HlyD family secretion protein
MSTASLKRLLSVGGQRSAKEDAMLPAVLEFQWPSTAIVNAPIPRSARGTVWIISSMIFVLIAVSGVIPVDRVVTTRGLVVSQTPTILVQPLETAIVRSIDVREGQSVRSGQLLARLDPTFALADLTTLAGEMGSLQAEVARLQAEADGKPFTYNGSDFDWLLQAAIHAHRAAEFDAKVENFRHRADELGTVISRSQSDADRYRERLQLAQTIVEMHTKLIAQDSDSKLQMMLAVDNRVEMQRALVGAEETGEGAKRDQAALESERNAYIQGWGADVSQKLAETATQLNNAREQLSKAKLRRQLAELRSDRDAIVQTVAKVSEGSVLQSGQQFITLVPIDAPLEIETNIFGQENGYVHVGDPVVIKFDTFAYAQYGLAEGKVRMISPDSFSAQEEARNPTSVAPVPASGSEPFYRARIAIDKVALHDVPGGFRLMPGMPVTTDIEVGKRTVLKYLLGMVVPIGREAMREP